MVIVTGGSGLIGSNVIKSLNRSGITDILVVDDLTQGDRAKNLFDLDFTDYLDKDQFLAAVINRNIEASDYSTIFHLGACSDTTVWDGKYLMANNFEYSKTLLEWVQEGGTSFIYASSASVYGLGKNGFTEVRACESPINLYAFSKFQFDQYVRSRFHELKSQVVGLRYFNVFGPGEFHKGSMASTVLHFYNQVKNSGSAKIFGAYGGYEPGGHMRDFISVNDCAAVNLWFSENRHVSGIFNVGTGVASSFNELALIVCEWFRAQGLDAVIDYIEFPEHLVNHYQSYTCADMSTIAEAGYPMRFASLEEGVTEYLEWLKSVDG